MSGIAPRPTHQECIDCGKTLSMDRFNRLNRGYSNVCKACAIAERGAYVDRKVDFKEEERKRKIRERALQDFLVQVKGAKIDVPHISEFVAARLKKFGGMEDFVEFWHEHLMRAAQDKPGSRLVLDSCRTLSHLIISSTQNRTSAPDYSGMSDEDLEKFAEAIFLSSQEQQGLIESESFIDTDVVDVYEQEAKPEPEAS